MVIPYLVFSGNCHEAMTFYAEALQGEIVIMQSFADAPVEVKEEDQNRIFNSELVAGSIRIKASDDLPEHAVTAGSNMSLFTVFPDKSSKESAFSKLAEQGQVLFPLDDHFGMLRDKYGMQWMMVHEDQGL